MISSGVIISYSALTSTDRSARESEINREERGDIKKGGVKEELWWWEREKKEGRESSKISGEI